MSAVKLDHEDPTKIELVRLHLPIALTKGSSGRLQFLMDKLTDKVLAECAKGNYRPLQMVASGEAFR